MHTSLRAGVALLALSPLSAFATTIGYTGAVVQYTVQTTGIYNIVSYGASGGGAVTAGGKGAEIGGDFALTAGEILQIVVGGQGVGAVNFNGGGGGTYVVAPGSTPLLVAGGGGGGGDSVAGGDGLATTAGGSGTGGSGGAGGTAGSGGGAGGGQGGGGGGGFTGSGAGNPTPTSSNAGGAGGQSYATGSAGGTALFGGVGGFGGGGGGGFDGAGGGGGYSGGGGGYGGFIEGGGGGGGSFDAGMINADLIELAGINSGNGYVVITNLTPVSTTPEPSGLILLGTAAAGLAGALRRRLA